MRILGQEAVPRVNRVSAGDLGRAQDIWDAAVAEGIIRGADAHMLIGDAYMQGIGIHVGMDRDGLDAELLASPDDPKGNFTAIGNQDFFKHRETPITWR
jgi:hypothetical protein